MIRIDQVKTGRSYNKAIDEDVKRLFDKACEYTQKNYGDTEYVFVICERLFKTDAIRKDCISAASNDK